MKSRLLTILLLLGVIHEVKSSSLSSLGKSHYLDIEEASRKLNTTYLGIF